MDCVENRVRRLFVADRAAVLRLLVSVRNGAEAQAALVGGADIIDVKEPTAGSLGRASSEAMRDVAAIVQAESETACSVALGELHEISGELGRITIPYGVRWVKLGLSRCRTAREWQRDWLHLRQQIGSRAEWIAVAYVDAELAQAPTVRDVAAAAMATQCAGLLLDTFSKSSGTLLDHLPLEEISAITREVQAAGLLVALAGRVQRTDLPALTAIQPDIIAVRSAVCRNRDRTAAIDAALVAEFRQAMEAASVAAR